MISVIYFTALWTIFGIIFPFVIPKGPNRRILHVILMITVATCWLFCGYMAQMNPLIRPKLPNKESC
ncbi:V-type proton ATPase subunit e 2 [Blattella germanica]|nr:V-type proton ATPase subunit e 2 [Blattella germanica]